MANPAHSRGHAGEQSMGFYWGERGYFLVDGPSGAGGHAANAAGFDGIAFNPKTGHMVIYDNKAFARDGNVYSATAISENLAKNLTTLEARVSARPDIPEQPTVLANIRAARGSLGPGPVAAWPRHVQLAVSNASGQSTGVGGQLANGTISFIDYYAAPPPKSAAGPTPPQPMAINLTYSVRGQANASAMVVLFMTVDAVANYINGYFLEADVGSALRGDMQSVRDWQRNNPTDGALVVITFRRTVINSEFMQNKVLIHPGDAFEYSSIYFGERPEDAAKLMEAEKSWVQGDTIDGPYKTVRRKQGIWIPPRQGKVESVFQSPVGRWRVKIGNWNGVFVFRQNGSCSWSESGGPEHTGSWKITGGEVQWTYSDDAEGWERIFHARLPLKIRVSGEATIHGVDHGYYEMSKQA